jgi:citrate lyase subunit beta/citryl-CoA lyase
VSRAADTCIVPLFVPGDRPDRFAKANSAGADLVIVDLEDAVSAANKDRARNALLASGLRGALVRINGAGTAWFDLDLAMLANTDIGGVLVPKVEGAETLETVRRALHPGAAVIAIIETAAGLAAIANIAPAACRLAFGSIDFAADLNCGLDRDALLLARTNIVLHSRLAGRPPPLDGVTLRTDDPALVAADARYAASLGFGGKLCIHPGQIAPIRAGFSPTAAELAWARAVLAVGEPTTRDPASVKSTVGAFQVDGEMVDAPVIVRARQIMARAKLAPAA